MRKARKDFGDCFAGKLSRGDADKIGMWMCEKQAHEFFPGVTGRANNRRRCPAAEASRLYTFFLHNAQCVFRLDAIATKHSRRTKDFAVASCHYGCSLSRRRCGDRDLCTRSCDHPFQILHDLAAGEGSERAGWNRQNDWNESPA